MRENLDVFSLRGELALITGGATGLGFATASAMIRAGARVIITGRREHVLAEAVTQLGPDASWHVHDVKQVESAEQLVAEISGQHGSPTILVNNAGIHLKKDTAATSCEEFRAMLDTHVIGAFGITHAALVGMTRIGRGNVVFIASMASLIGMPKVIAYSAAKSAYLGMGWMCRMSSLDVQCI